MSGWRCRKMSQSRINTVASGGPASGVGGLWSYRSQRVGIPLIPSKTRALQCRAPQYNRPILQLNFRLPVEKTRQRQQWQKKGKLYPNSEQTEGRSTLRYPSSHHGGQPSRGKSSSEPQPQQRSQRSLKRKILCTKGLTRWCESPSCDKPSSFQHEEI